VFWTEQLAMTIVVVLYAFAIVLRADLSEKAKIEMGGWVITTIVVLLICGVAIAMAAVIWVNKQIDLDQKNDVNF
jgi:protein-S-isoprenylcysteine O-methyltransferase Ste14